LINNQTPLGRRLRLGVVGGGLSSFIGSVHRGAALMNGQYEVIAGVFSSDPLRSLAAAEQLLVPRGYGSAAEMIRAESLRDDGIDVIAIMTPNNSHYEIACLALEHNLHVMCEKPLTNSLEEALALEKQVQKSQQKFCVAYCYSGYPMVRQAKAMIAAGDLGEIRMVQCNYVQGHLAQLTDSELDQSNWHMEPAIAGPDLIVGDIGTHCYHLANFVSGMLPSEISADNCTLVPGRKATDYTNIQLRYSNGARGSLWITQAAAGAEHGLYLRVCGSKGGIEWSQEQPNELLYRRLDAPAQCLVKGGPGLYDIANQASQMAIGHPEGYRESFATLYADFAESIIGSKLGRENKPSSEIYPKITDGVQGVSFIQATVDSSAKNGAWVKLDCT
jgi:predicted dehydrogenase